MNDNYCLSYYLSNNHILIIINFFKLYVKIKRYVLILLKIINLIVNKINSYCENNNKKNEFNVIINNNFITDIKNNFSKSKMIINYIMQTSIHI